MTETQFIENKVLREKYISRFEVLEKVKTLLLIPKMECMTIKQVADFYEVGEDTIKSVVLRNKDELESDGMCYKTPVDFKIFKGSSCTFKNLRQEHGKLIVQIVDTTTLLEIPNRGIRCFPRRAILRMGMLLRDSKVAKEVRTQLLNIEEKTGTSIKTKDINEEEKLLLDVGRAYASGNIDSVMQAATKYNGYLNRYINQLKSDNKALSKDILEWKDRMKLNAGVRMLASKTKTYYGALWNELYKNLQYKYGICLKQRGGKPYLQWIKETEWSNIIKTFCAMCEAYGQSPSEMFQQTTPICNLSK